MLARELIAELERRIEANRPHEYALGELEIHIDQFSTVDGVIKFDGVSPEIRITPSADGVLHILTAWSAGTK